MFMLPISAQKQGIYVTAIINSFTQALSTAALHVTFAPSKGDYRLAREVPVD